MRYFLFAVLCVTCVFYGFGQTTANNYGRIDVEFTKEKRSQKAYAKAEIRKAFIGGDSLWLQSFEKQLNESLQIDKRVKEGKYIVSVQFVVAEDSSLSDIRPLTAPGFGMTQAVLSALRKGRIRWGPDSTGRPVRPYRRSAITYSDSNYHRR